MPPTIVSRGGRYGVVILSLPATSPGMSPPIALNRHAGKCTLDGSADINRPSAQPILRVQGLIVLRIFSSPVFVQPRDHISDSTDQHIYSDRLVF